MFIRFTIPAICLVAGVACGSGQPALTSQHLNEAGLSARLGKYKISLLQYDPDQLSGTLQIAREAILSNGKLTADQQKDLFARLDSFQFRDGRYFALIVDHQQPLLDAPHMVTIEVRDQQRLLGIKDTFDIVNFSVQGPQSGHVYFQSVWLLQMENPITAPCTFSVVLFRDSKFEYRAGRK